MPETGLRIGIDLGGTKISGILMNDSGGVLDHIRIKSPRNNYSDTISAIRTVVDRLTDSQSLVIPVGVGMPGAISPASGLVKNANSTWLNDHPLDRDLAEALDRPVKVANDANCFALSEAQDGAGANGQVVFGVILGTGTGGALVLDGKLLQGRNAIAGEWGHNPLPWADPERDPFRPCYCGKTGCIETFMSGPGLAEDHALRTGDAATPEQIMAGDTPTRADSRQRYADRLARGLAHVINIADPDFVVLGGGLSRVDFLYDTVPALLPRYVFSDNVDTALVRNRHGDDSGVRGAARLWAPGEAVSR